MPLDKQKSGTPAKPFTPTLSTHFRNTKSPLTPKLAGSKNASPASPPRRHLRSESTATPTSRRDDLRTPNTTSKLYGNVTPRSGARLSRIGGDSPSTPGVGNTGTPSRSRPTSAIELSKSSTDSPIGAGLGISTLDDNRSACSGSSTVPARSLVSGGRARGVSTGSTRNTAAEAVPPIFFPADDAQSSVASELEERPKIRNPATFFYASDAIRRTNSPEVLVTTSDISLNKDQRAKFFYADNSPSVQPTTSQKQTMGLKACPTSMPLSQPHPQNNQVAPRVLQRPASPVKPTSMRSAPATFTSSKGDSVKSGSSDASYKLSNPATPCDSPRPGSSGSKTSIAGGTTQRKLPKANSPPSTPPQRLDLHTSTIKAQSAAGQPAMSLSPLERFSPRSTSLSSSNTGVSSQTLESTSSNSLLPLSPTKSETPQPTQLQRTNELAANARRERKVLDLEISNSSLLAINRTLEREMRKQSAELRRFRRLSRSGRLSLASGSMRSASGLSTLTESDNGNSPHVNPSDLDEEKSDSECEEDDLDSSLDEDDPSSLLSPTPHTDHDSRHRARDEKRLMLDLSKHQQLLIDSQKMNQSIKRCLTWTDQLIIEARKALDYNVKVSDVELGGKVLACDEEDEGGGGSKALLSPSLVTPILTEMDWGVGGESSKALLSPSLVGPTSAEVGVAGEGEGS